MLGCWCPLLSVAGSVVSCCFGSGLVSFVGLLVIRGGVIMGVPLWSLPPKPLMLAPLFILFFQFIVVRPVRFRLCILRVYFLFLLNK
jgi:hypothetical protein